ncbi:MAG: O-sialoglycoprotein endopeptidase [Firmicutes bacterium]|nr:O-sialoglycoprotein endopeptidase [Bacillota bacterium]
MRVFLGIDTSNYTTSMCLMGEDGKIIADERIVLQVASGSRGLRQSEALFQHVQNLPKLSAQLQPALAGCTPAAIGVSTRPRPQEDSYMPVFLPGWSLAHSLANLLRVPCHELSHQENHIWSGVASAPGPTGLEFLAIHLSGGTTELTHVQRDKHTHLLDVELWGGTSDLHAGQFVDRLGVRLGLDFPAGEALEKLAGQTAEVVPVPTFHREGLVSFSGPLTALERLVGQAEPPVLARSCIFSIARTLVKWIRWAESRTDCRELLLVGGVASNALIRAELRRRLPGWKLFYAAPRYSVDNAYGAAYFSALREGVPLLPSA